MSGSTWWCLTSGIVDVRCAVHRPVSSVLPVLLRCGRLPLSLFWGVGVWNLDVVWVGGVVGTLLGV